MMYLSISSSVMPIPLSLMVKVLFFSSSDTRTVKSPSSPLNSPFSANVFIFCVASTALLTISRKKISWSEYKNFLITGNMFSVVTPMFPFCMVVYLIKLCQILWKYILQILCHYEKHFRFDCDLLLYTFVYVGSCGMLLIFFSKSCDFVLSGEIMNFKTYANCLKRLTLRIEIKTVRHGKS